MFLTTEGFVLPRVLLLEAAHMVCAAGILVGDKLRDAHVSLDSPTSARWTTVRDRALLAAFAFQAPGDSETDPKSAAAES